MICILVVPHVLVCSYSDMHTGSVHVLVCSYSDMHTGSVHVLVCRL